MWNTESPDSCNYFVKLSNCAIGKTLHDQSMAEGESKGKYDFPSAWGLHYDYFNGSDFSYWNSVWDEPLDKFEFYMKIIHIFGMIYYSILILFGLIGNVLIIAPYVKSSTLRRVSCNIFIVHMAVVNLLNILVLYPILIAIIVWIDVVDVKNNFLCKCIYVSYDMLFIHPSFFSVLCVAVNRCLLIASPQKQYLRFCSRTPIAIILTTLWISLSLRAGLFLAYGEVSTDYLICLFDGYRYKWVEHVEIVYLVFLICIPTVVIPICHGVILCRIRSSRKRVATEHVVVRDVEDTGDEANDELTNNSGGKMRVMSENSTAVTSVSVAALLETAYTDDDLPGCSSAADAPTTSDVSVAKQTINSKSIPCQVDIKISSVAPSTAAGGSRNDPQTDTVPSKQWRQRTLASRHHGPPRSTFKLKTRSTTKSALNPPGPNNNAGPRRAEVRLVKMMIVMYFIILGCWSGSVIADNFGGHWFIAFLFTALGGLMPIFHALIPFIYLWGNRNYHDVIKSFRLYSWLCKKRNTAVHDGWWWNLLKPQKLVIRHKMIQRNGGPTQM